MKIAKEQWQQWAEQHAEPKAWEIAKAHKLDILAVAALKCMFEQSVMLGMELVETMRREGYDTSEAQDLTTALMRAKDTGVITLKVDDASVQSAEVSDGGPLTHESHAAQSRRSLH